MIPHASSATAQLPVIVWYAQTNLNSCFLENVTPNAPLDLPTTLKELSFCRTRCSQLRLVSVSALSLTIQTLKPIFAFLATQSARHATALTLLAVKHASL